jgi:hypothetical protein
MKPAPLTLFFAAAALLSPAQSPAAPPTGFFNKLCSSFALKRTPEAQEAPKNEPEITPEPAREVHVAITPLEVDLSQIGNNLIPGSSILFFKGFIPEPGQQWTYEFMKLTFKLHLFMNPESGVVLLYSKEGLSHAELKKLVPEGSEILGGVRFDSDPNHPGKIRIINSTHFSQFKGPSILDQNFILKF